MRRRDILLSAAALAACATRPERPSAETGFESIEATLGGGRLGVAALNTATNQSLAHRAGERFAMCSTFKWLLAAAVLDSARRGGPAPDQVVRFNDRDLLDYAPVTRAHVTDGPLGRMGAMTIEELCAAAVTVSDNTAANLLLDALMGPQGLTRFARGVGDSDTRLDRTEPSLNENAPGDPRDTTTPEAMARTARRVLTGDVLSAPLREKLIGWMVECQTGLARLRAGLPANWRVGDKTGTGANGAANDVAIAWPPGRAPILIACYISEGSADADARNAAHAAVARRIAALWG